MGMRMSFLTVVLLVAVIALWSRIRTLERRVSEIDRNNAAAPPARAIDSKTAPFETHSAQAVATTDDTAMPIAAPSEPEPTSEPMPVRSADPIELPPAVPEPIEPDRPAPENAQPRKIEFEELFGSRLPIWAGGITLAVAGLFIVKYSIDAGLLSPAVRVVLGLLFSIALAGGAEFARRWKKTAIDPRVAQALAGAGIASAYSSILIATNLYDLVSPTTGFIGLALTTAAAMGLALRFGAPAAVLGLVGGLAAPALVGESTGNIAPLTAYLALVIGGLAGVGRQQRWAWLTALALIGGFGWGLLLIAFETLDPWNSSALGAYSLILAFAVPLLLTGANHDRLLRAGAAILGAVQIALIVMQGGYTTLHWGFYGLLSIGAIVLARMDNRMAMLPPIALGIGLVTMTGWSDPSPALLALVSGGFILIFGGSALASLWGPRGSLRDAFQAAAALGGTLAAACYIAPSNLLTNIQWSWLSIAAAFPLAAFALIGARRALPHRDPRFLVLVTAATFLGCIALPQLFEHYALPALYALAVAALIELWRRRGDLDYRGATIIALIAALAAMVESVLRWLGASLSTLAGEPLFVTALPSPRHALGDMLIPAAILGIAAWRAEPRIPAMASRILPALFTAIAGAALFIFYKHSFAIDSGSRFTAYGLLERVLFDQLLFVIGWAALARRDLRPGLRLLGLGATATALARVILYNALLFDPLWRDQLVGTLPLANLLVPAFLLPLAWLAFAARAEPALAARFKPFITAIQMLLVTLFVFASLRQIFHGSLLAVGSVGQGEDISRSLAAIALAIGFLRWGIFKRERPWRIASLALMLLAVIKVFVVDTSGLDGLLRICSFVALGFALIGIGWLYSRHLKSDEAESKIQ
jgi:uncharacterized membrane protein